MGMAADLRGLPCQFLKFIRKAVLTPHFYFESGNAPE
jgi:hypothetical protein